ncbi:PP2C family protein-serine/threonine phosphatase [Sphingomonas sp. LT1P40]|uniref:PP2C family protein-serine/threonine phosphatase n=1 Tax=Alteristakelama amylovorans TaxID=3096166 RepID=UPI002FCC1A1C
MRAYSVARSHVGLVRKINEDRVFDWPDGEVWAVVDGMGGHRGGDLAAQSAVDRLRKLTVSIEPITPAAVTTALDQANIEIADRNASLGEEAGATAVVLSRHGATATIAWVGDSRCYRIRNGDIELLTRDHSVVQELIDAGLLTSESASHHPHSNVITRALGVERHCTIDVREVELIDGDIFLLCSDGLSRSLRDTDLIEDDLEASADRLLKNALYRDGGDNISLIVVRFCN